MNYKQKKALIIETMSVMDVTGINAKLWEDKLNNMTESQFNRMISNPDFKFIPEVASFDNEVDYNMIVAFHKKKGIKMVEKCVLPYTGHDIVTQSPITIMPLTVQMLQQVIEKENASSSDTKKRNSMNQAIGSDKSAQMSDLEVNALVSSGRTEVINEMMSPRAGNGASKNKLYSDLKNQGSAKMPTAEIHDPKNKTEINVIKNKYIGMAMVFQTEDDQ